MLLRGCPSTVALQIVDGATGAPVADWTHCLLSALRQTNESCRYGNHKSLLTWVHVRKRKQNDPPETSGGSLGFRAKFSRNFRPNLATVTWLLQIRR